MKIAAHDGRRHVKFRSGLDVYSSWLARPERTMTDPRTRLEPDFKLEPPPVWVGDAAPPL